MDRLFPLLGAVAGFLAVAAGAFGAHALKTRLQPDLLTAFETGVRYQMYHALALFLVGWVASRATGPEAGAGALTQWAGWLFVTGIVLFSGSLYALALTGHRWLGAVTPLGGLAFLAGWLCLGLALRRA